MYRVETNNGVFHVRFVADDMVGTVAYFEARGYAVHHIEPY